MQRQIARACLGDYNGYVDKILVAMDAAEVAGNHTEIRRLLELVGEKSKKTGGYAKPNTELHDLDQLCKAAMDRITELTQFQRAARNTRNQLDHSSAEFADVTAESKFDPIIHVVLYNTVPATRIRPATNLRINFCSDSCKP